CLYIRFADKDRSGTAQKEVGILKLEVDHQAAHHELHQSISVSQQP
ncbi:hypothetical protein SAMN05421827_1311, partial [Pedobacter terrae]